MTFDITTTSIHFMATDYSVTNPASIDKFWWKLSTDDEWTEGTYEHTFTDLSPDTEYTAQFRIQDNYGTYSDTVTATATTSEPDKPTVTSFYADNITGNSLTLHFDGTFAEDYPSQYEMNGRFYIDKWMGSYWSQIALLGYRTKQFNVTNLEEETEYRFRIRLMDYYGNYSDYKFVNATTLFVGKRCYVKVGSQTKYGIVHIKANGQVVRATGMWIKDNGQLREV